MLNPIKLLGLGILFLPLITFASDDCQLRTQTPGGWGAPANGNNPGVYRDANFESAFPEGLTVGCEENQLVLTSAQAVEDYLPCGGQPNPLDESYEDPGCIGNVFSGHIVALTLSVGFDNNDPDFGESNTSLADAIIGSGNFEGWSVGEFLSLANDVFGGCNDNYSASQISSTLADINESNVDGDGNNGFLLCDEGCIDEIPPAVEECPEDAQYSCADEWGVSAPVFSDDSSFDVIESVEEISEGCTTTYIYTWTATDVCGNESTCETTIQVTDDEAPTIEGLPEDLTIECDDLLPEFNISASDNCSGVSLTVEDVFIPGDCPSTGTIEYTVVATDDCGNEANASFTFTIEDNTSPELIGVPDNITLNCGDPLPEPPMVDVIDSCDPNVEVIFSEEINEVEGDACTLILPLNEYYDEDWALILPDFAPGYEFYHLVSGSWIDNGDGTASIEASFASVDNPNGGWNATVDLYNGLDWDAWSNQDFPTNYKDDFNLAGDEYLNWIYYLISDASYMEGWGDFEGSYFNLSHAPSGGYYGYQVGIAANNVNENYGSGGWFDYEGIFIDSSTGFNGDLDGSGDFAFEHLCCDSPSATWTWTATDCAGNSVSESTTIVYSGNNPDGLVAGVSPCLGDMGGNGVVDNGDFLILLSEYGRTGEYISDLNSDGSVDTIDILDFISRLGTTCE